MLTLWHVGKCKFGFNACADISTNTAACASSSPSAKNGNIKSRQDLDILGEAGSESNYSVVTFLPYIASRPMHPLDPKKKKS